MKSKNKTIYDYKNADIIGLIKHIKEFDFNTNVFSYPIEAQTGLYSKVITDAFAQFVPCKTVNIRQNDQPWSNSYTRLLLRKKNRNYRFYKKCSNEYNFLLQNDNTNPDVLTKYRDRKEHFLNLEMLLTILTWQIEGQNLLFLIQSIQQ